jgi:hypothetical protein
MAGGGEDVGDVLGVTAGGGWVAGGEHGEGVQRGGEGVLVEREIHSVDELPKIVSGKLRRVELHGWLLNGGLPEGGA